MTESEKKSWPFSEEFRQKARIDTQIHRRRKVKAMSPLEPEWEGSESDPPAMKKQPETAQ